MRNRSKKHHYLPRHFLKGFTDDKNCFFVYDKQKNKIFYTSPEATFFKNDLNTIFLPESGASDFLEELYANVEGLSWNSLDKIRLSHPKKLIDLFDKMNLFLFLLFQHWRLPRNIGHAEDLSEKLFTGEESVFDFIKLTQTNGESVSEEIAKTMRQSHAFQKVTRVIAPLVPFYKDKDWSYKLSDWKLFYTADSKSWYMVGDSPIITNGKNDHDPINCLSEFIFPVSGKILLVNYKKAAKKDLSEKFIISYSTAVIENANRFVACHNKEFLEMLVERYRLCARLNKPGDILSEMFKALE